MLISCPSIPCTLLGTSLTFSLSSRQCLEDTVFAFCVLSLLLAYAVPSTWLAVPHLGRENCQLFFQGAVRRLLPVEVSAGGSASQLSPAEALPVLPSRASVTVLISENCCLFAWVPEFKGSYCVCLNLFLNVELAQRKCLIKKTC